MEQETSLHEKQVGYLHKYGFLCYDPNITDCDEVFREIAESINIPSYRIKRAI